MSNDDKPYDKSEIAMIKMIRDKNAKNLEILAVENTKQSISPTCNSEGFDETKYLYNFDLSILPIENKIETNNVNYFKILQSILKQPLVISNDITKSKTHGETEITKQYIEALDKFKKNLKNNLIFNNDDGFKMWMKHRAETISSYKEILPLMNSLIIENLSRDCTYKNIKNTVLIGIVVEELDEKLRMAHNDYIEQNEKIKRRHEEEEEEEEEEPNYKKQNEQSKEPKQSAGTSKHNKSKHNKSKHNKSKHNKSKHNKSKHNKSKHNKSKHNKSKHFGMV